MEFSQRLAKLRKDKGLTQQSLADKIGITVLQIKRYESGSSQPTLEVVRKLATTLSVNVDALVFDQDERGPDEEFKLQFEAISRLSLEEKKIVKAVLEGLILRSEAKRWAS